MVYIRNMNRYFAIGFILALLSGIMVFGLTHVASAQDRGSRQHEFMAPRSQHTPSFGAPRSQHIPSYSDSRYHHNRSYPVRGHYVGAVPRGHYSVYHGGVRYRYYGGAWYCPYGSRFVIVAPPVRSCRLSALFAFVLTTLWIEYYLQLHMPRNILHANCGWLYGR